MTIQFKTVKHPELLADLAFTFIGFSAVKYGTMQAYTLRSNGTVCHTTDGSINSLIKGGKVHALIVAHNRTDAHDNEYQIIEALKLKLPVLTEAEFRAILRADKVGKNLLNELRQRHNKPAKKNQSKAISLNAWITKQNFGIAEYVV